MSELLKIAANGQWSLEKTATNDEKGRCFNCGSKSCVGYACKEAVADDKAAVSANDKHNEGFKNKIKIAAK